MSKLLCKYAKTLREHFVNKEAKGDLKRLLKEAGANAEEAADIERIANKTYKKTIKEGKDKFLQKLYENPKIKQNSKAYDELVDGLIEGKKDIGSVRSQVAESFNIPRLKPEKAKEISDLAAKIQKLPDGNERDLLQKQLSATITSVIDPTFAEKLFSYSNMNVLFAAPGRLRDFISSGANYAVNKMDRALATTLDAAISPLTKTRTAKFTGAYRPATYGKAFKEGFEDVTKRGFVESGGQALPLTFSKNSLYGQAERLLKGFMQGTDRANSMLTATDSLIDQLAAKGVEIPKFKSFEDVQKFVKDIEAGKVKGITKDEFLEMHMIAELEGAAMSFRQPSALKKFMSGIEQTALKSDNPILKYGVPYFTRFTGTMLNVAMTGLERTPLGIAKAFVKNGYDALVRVPKGEISKHAVQRAFTLELSRALTGTFGTGALGYFLAKEGYLVEQPASNRKEADGKGYKNKQYIKVGDYYLDPGFMTIIFPSAEMGAIAQKKGFKSQEFLESIYKTPISAFTDLPVFQQFKQIASAKTMEGQRALAFAMQPLSSFIPFTVLMGEFARTLDTTARETYDKNPVIAAKNRIQANLPVLSKALPSRFDELGKEEKRSPVPEDIILSGVNAFLNPAFVQKVQRDSDLTEAQRIYQATGDKQALPKYARSEGKTVNIEREDGKKEKIQLNGKQLQAIQKEMGTYTKSMMRTAFSNPDFEELSDQEKADVMGQIISNAHKAAKVKVLGDSISERNRTRFAVAQGLLDGDEEGILNALEEKIYKTVDKRFDIEEDA